VALLGTIFQTLSRNQLKHNLASMPLSPGQKSAIADNIGQSSSGSHAASPQIVNAAHDAFIHGFTGAMTFSAAVAAAGSLLAFALIQPLVKRAPEAATAQAAEATAEPVGV
jgi:hypothetical protein